MIFKKKITPCIFYFRFYLSDSKTEQNCSLWLHPRRFLSPFLQCMPVQECVPMKARNRYLISSGVALHHGFWDRVSWCLVDPWDLPASSSPAPWLQDCAISSAFCGYQASLLRGPCLSSMDVPLTHLSSPFLSVLTLNLSFCSSVEPARTQGKHSITEPHPDQGMLNCFLYFPFISFVFFKCNQIALVCIHAVIFATVGIFTVFQSEAFHNYV